MSKLTNDLYVGSVEESFDLTDDVTSVLNVASEIDIGYRLGRTYIKIPVNDDDPTEDITKILPACMDFIKKNKPTFVHCLEGKSRSVIVCLCYLVENKGYMLEIALALLKSLCDNIDIYPNYLQQLKKLFKEITQLILIDGSHYEQTTTTVSTDYYYSNNNNRIA
jgi:protein-tyrosine phosphatase